MAQFIEDKAPFQSSSVFRSIPMIFRSGLPKSLIHLLAITALSVILPACGGGDDDDLGDPGDGENDTAAPIIVDIFPIDGGLIADLNTSFYIQFNEDMDPSSAAGNITLSSGTIGGIVWTNPTALELGPSSLPEAAEITLTVGTGLSDANGNSLAAPFTATYTTIANQVALVEVSPVAGAVNVNRNTNIGLKFTEPVGNVFLGITISDGNKVDYNFSATDDNRGNHTLNPDGDLPEDTEFTVTVNTLVYGTITETSLAGPESFSFTTGVELDNTPPSIVSLTPASGATLPVDQGTITIEFDEAINLTNFNPTSMNGQFAWAFIEAGLEPELSPDGTILTVYLPAIMPEGLSLEVVLANYEDQYGNVQYAETAWSATVAGNASPLYLKDGHRYTASGTEEEGELGNETPTSTFDTYRFYEIGARGAANQWEFREYEWQYSFLDYYEILSVTSAGVSILGFAEDEGSG
ncbi:MAG: methionine-rich copper-binding protein CopC, partial [Candidatus Krumholzibacteriia bacterium]